MKLSNVCIISDEVKRLSVFYEEVLSTKGEFYGEDYCVLNIGETTLSIFSYEANAKLFPKEFEVASNRSTILEFSVEDVDKEYARLKELDIDWYMEPTDLPWGTRSIYFRDPAGNMVCIYNLIS